MKMQKSVNDMVHEVHLALLNDDAAKFSRRYTKFLEAVYDPAAVEGSLAADDFCAAVLIRKKAKEMPGASALCQQNLTTIVKALNVVLQHDGQSRDQRRGGYDAGDTDLDGGED